MREMKDSRVPWLGQIPKEWEVAPLWRTLRKRNEDNHSDEIVLSLYRDLGIVPKDSRDDNHNVTSLDTTNYKFVRIGDFVINKMKAWQGSMAVSGFQGIVSPAYHVCEFINKNVDPHYLHFLLRDSTYLPEYDRLSTGLRVGQWDLSYDDFKNIPHLIPPYKEQQQIVEFLNSKCADIDIVIEKSKTSIKEYTKLKQSIITSAVTKGLRDNRPMKISGIKWIDLIPEDWIESKIKYETQYNIESLTEQTDNDFEFDYIDIGSVEYGIGITHTERCKFGSAPSRARRVVHNGDVIVSTVRTYLKAMAKINAISFPTIVSTGFAVLTCMKGFLADFLYYYVQSVPFIEFVITHSTGIGYPSINCSDLVSASILKPSIEEQAEIASYLDQKCSEIDSLIASKEKFITELEIYKKSLIHEYVTGKKEVPTTV